jgi:acyl-coenzyme A thioesterase 13
MTVESIGGGQVTCSLKVEPQLRNAYGTLHGGAISTIVDVVGSLALLGVDPTRGGVSVDLNVTFVRAAKAGSTVIAVGKVTKTGRKLGFTEVELTDKETGKVIALGRHTKAL